MSPFAFLRGIQERMPAWLEQFKNGDVFRRDQFFKSRVVFYPGSGFDGSPVEIFGSTGCAHTFVYVDYQVTQAEIEAELSIEKYRFRGYVTLARVALSESVLTPKGWRPHIDPSGNVRGPAGFTPFGFLEVLERESGLDDTHGPARLAIIFLGADGIAAYDALFCQGDGTPAPFAIVLQDHGFGGNYDRFGKGGALESIANKCRAMPKYLLVAEENTGAWDGFEKIQDVDGYPRGIHRSMRFLYTQRDAQSRDQLADRVIVDYVRRQYGILIGEATAEKIRSEVGSVGQPAQAIDAVGRHLESGVPRSFTLGPNEILNVLEQSGLPPT